MRNPKRVIAVHSAPEGHWVGDGFPVRTLFPQPGLDAQMSPFLLLDYAGPSDFAPSDTPRGVGEHPHRGFETVTVVYQGEVAHRDSAGNQGVIGPGDVQWMTAASGVVHEEMHTPAFTRRGGPMEMVQLWVNLPRAHKMAPPRYQTLERAAIPEVELPGGGRLRIIAGAFDDRHGPAMTFTPLDLWDLRLPAGGSVELPLTAGHTTAIFVLSGAVTVNDGEARVADAELALLTLDGETAGLRADAETRLLVLAGEPIREPVARYGPFVMNTRAELQQAFEDYQAGRMGHLA